MGRDVTVGIADVVRDTRRGHGVDAVGQWDEHGIRVRDGKLIREGAAEVSGGESHPVSGERGDLETAAGVPRAAGNAGAAADLKGHDHAITRLDRDDLLADGEHLRNAFVSKMEGKRQLGGAQHERTIDVAGG